MTTRLPKPGFVWDPLCKEAPEDVRALKFTSALTHAPASGGPAALRAFVWRKSAAIKSGLGKQSAAALVVFGCGFRAAGEVTNRLSLSGTPALPDVGVSLLRVLGALVVVIAIFLGGVWLFRNWQRLTIQRGHAPKLNIVEARSLGGRHALYVVAYEQERFLLAASPTGVSLLSHLQPAPEEAAAPKRATPPPSFAQTLTQMLKGK